VATGRLEANAVVSVVAAEVAHLQDCCGKRVEPVVDQHVRN
jgi:hypothetical protein